MMKSTFYLWPDGFYLFADEVDDLDIYLMGSHRGDDFATLSLTLPDMLDREVVANVLSQAMMKGEDLQYHELVGLSKMLDLADRLRAASSVAACADPNKRLMAEAAVWVQSTGMALAKQWRKEGKDKNGKG